MNQELEQLVGKLQGQKLLVAGDIMLDRFVYGQVERISPESPVPVLVIAREDSMLGGAGNALANLAGLGAKGAILSVIGDDAEGEIISEKTRVLGFDTDGLLVDETRPTIIKTRFLAGHQQLLRTDFEKKAPVQAALGKKTLEAAKNLMKDADALLLSDYGKGVLTPEIIAALIRLAKDKKIPVVVDPKGNDFSIYKGADVITPNRKELSEATRGMDVNTDDEVVAAAEKIIRTCGIKTVLATRSRDGMSIITKGENPLHIRGPNIEVFDVSGAGDAVIATLAAALSTGATLENAARLANFAGGIVVTKVGTAAVRAKELLESCRDENAYPYAGQKAPLADIHEAGESVSRWRARGLKIGFTNGCFDILHAGHVTYLNAARGRCDKLVVGLNRDASVRLLKGEGRPVHDEEARAAVLAALACIDMVILFGADKAGADNTAVQVVKALRPDFYFKGGDYTKDQVPEAPSVESCGGEVVIIPAVPGQSTTSSLRKIKNEAA
ncbi:MAG: D-glycero-beta-D-manno-heptose-7-phosphate kinase [Alphaproteobacteria bacterium]